ncbi:MAG TPA: histidine--tRNA ligase [Candidatus Saccharimonadales bacterium]|nr:histidine--tRNA ligase [Candidatus Saccharimonadales bacterium]
MSLSTQPYKGARDFYPEDKRIQKYMFGKLREVVESFGYQEYDAPILESFDIYAAKSGEEIVNEQLYSFEDKGGRKVAIRPEMTPSVSRMVAARRQELPYPLRLYSIPNLWRYERPQRGRLREHNQLNVDLFGVEGLDGDAEIIQVADAILKSFGAKSSDYEIRINSRGYMNQQFESFGLSDDQKHLCLKLLDKQSKIEPNEFEKMFIEKLGDGKGSQLLNFLKSEEVPKPVAELLRVLNLSGVESAAYDPAIVRGLDYYTDIIFEVFDTDPENNRSMFGGGRYDGLVGLFGAEPVPTVGFGMGDVTLQNFLEAHGLLPGLGPETDAAAILIGDVYAKAQAVVGEFRKSGLKIAVDSSGRKLDAQIRSAVKSGVRYAIFIGEKELQSGRFQLRDLKNGTEKELPKGDIVSAIQESRAG